MIVSAAFVKSMNRQIILQLDDRRKDSLNQQPMSFLEYMKRYLYYLVKWFVLALLIGSLCGLIGALFFNGIVLANALRADHPWLLFLMPASRAARSCRHSL